MLICSNVFMTFAWYGNLKLQQMNLIKDWPLIGIIVLSWGMAFFEYTFMIPANRIGSQITGGPFSLMQLKIIQECISLFVFTVIRGSSRDFQGRGTAFEAYQRVGGNPFLHLRGHVCRKGSVRNDDGVLATDAVSGGRSHLHHRGGEEADIVVRYDARFSGGRNRERTVAAEQQLAFAEEDALLVLVGRGVGVGWTVGEGVVALHHDEAAFLALVVDRRTGRVLQVESVQDDRPLRTNLTFSAVSPVLSTVTSFPLTETILFSSPVTVAPAAA